MVEIPQAIQDAAKEAAHAAATAAIQAAIQTVQKSPGAVAAGTVLAANGDTTKPWQSKTLWVSLIVALAPLLPPVQAVLIANPTLVTSAVACVFAALRLMSSQKISLK